MRLLHRAAFHRKALCSSQGDFNFLDNRTVDPLATSGRVSMRAMRANLYQSWGPSTTKTLRNLTYHSQILIQPTVRDDQLAYSTRLP